MSAGDDRRDPLRDPLDAVLAIDRLEVGPVALEADRLRAPYKVVRAGAEDVFELVYRYREPVFTADPAARSWAERNLAAMIAAQVALNYGLFCRELVFHGPYDEADRRFLAEMVENTAREIYVNKLLRPNPFLRLPDGPLPAAKRERYSRARLRFEPQTPESPPESPPDSTSKGDSGWHGDPERWCVLSSGGKDSLLTYGLLDELGKETHPIFVNESGRHWFSALNAYRRFADEVPHTARVWTNCDRVFTFMLRHLPFVRSDFATVRADIYPLRLWTVAVFLFGVLPLLRKRGVGRLAIGDEYDTTVRVRDHGIPHHAGLYDQSRYFDHALSRYFRRKGWGLTQLSLLRPMSELLIEKVLAERYPALLASQVSCHAAHTEGETVLPCGRCEKCRRIVAMLIALGGDPAACGYPPEQQARTLEALAERGCHLERPALEHMIHLLAERGALAQPRLGAVRGRPRTEALALRFHPDRAPIDEVPLDLREDLYRLLLEHAEGAVRREGRRWIAFDPFVDPKIRVPYRFDRPAPGSAAGEDGAEEAQPTVLWAELSWPQIAARLREVDMALLPVGAIEQHGRHLPLDVDTFDAEHISRQVAAACSPPQPLVLPAIPYGVSYHHDDFKGTLSVGNETLARMVYDVGMSVAKNGINKLIIVNGHGGNGPTLHFAAQMINRDAHIFTCVDSGETSDAEVDALTEAHNDAHAGDIETSTTLYMRPHLVDMSLAERADAPFSSDFLDFGSARSVEWYARTARISASGVLGDATAATAEKGERMWQVMIARLVELVEHLKDLSLDQIHERRY